MKYIKTFEEHSEQADIVYHVTSSIDVPEILKHGLIANKSKLGFTKNRVGKTLSQNGFIYAFEELSDAVRWLFHASWTNDGFDMDLYRIIKIIDDKSLYKPDEHWESLTGKGKWLMKKGNVPADKIILLPKITEGAAKFIINGGDITEGDL